jgi:cytochrome b
MKKLLAYDLPLRIFHWLFALLFVTAFVMGKTVDDDSSLFSYHMMAGLSIGFILTLRVVWGFIGTVYSRFSSFRLKPSELITYFKDLFTTKTKRWMGHNPASSFAAILMFVLTIGLMITGIYMSHPAYHELFEELHEIFANLFLIIVIAHIGGIIIHHLRHKDSIFLSMINGKKDPVEGQSEISTSKKLAGVLFGGLFGLWVLFLSLNFDTNQRSLTFFDTTFQIGEQAEDQSEDSGTTRDNEEEHEEHDD